ncbi:unnamed protein product [Linum trigynum]|uniref:Reverse transcriptase zinc-binding domain-containing protein n=1 Tax=Linum trigynum TaxID=586398 RepID=A0AAV2DTX3_9ROSI
MIESGMSRLLREVCGEKITEVVMKIPLGTADSRDKWIWRFNTARNYSVRSAYHTLREKRDQQGNQDLQGNAQQDQRDWKWLWSLSLPPKMRFFIMKFIRRAVATRERLFSRNCAPNPTCPICDAPSESVIHCLFFCHHATSTWALSGLMPSLLAHDSSFEYWLFTLPDTLSTTHIRKVVCYLWNIWFARNEFIFNDKAITPASTLTVSGRDFLDIEEARTTMTVPHIQPATQSRSQPRGSRSYPPPSPFSVSRVMNCDASFVSDSSVAAYGITISHSHDEVYDGKAETFLCSYMIQAEAFGLLNVILIAAQDPIPTSIRSDCQSLTLALRQNPLLWPWMCRATIARKVLVIQ